MDACHVNIDIPRILLLLRQKLAEGDPSWNVTVRSRLEQAAFAAWSLLIRHPRLYDLFLKSAFVGQKFLPGKEQMLHKLPFAGSGWTRSRDLKKIARKRFIGSKNL